MWFVYVGMCVFFLFELLVIGFIIIVCVSWNLWVVKVISINIIFVCWYKYDLCFGVVLESEFGYYL